MCPEAGGGDGGGTPAPRGERDEGDGRAERGVAGGDGGGNSEEGIAYNSSM